MKQSLKKLINFETYFEKRENAIFDLIEKATGKEVAGRNKKLENVDDSMFDEEELFL